MTPTAPRRRWLAFGLRTLFVVVTVLCLFGAWLGGQLTLIHARKAFLQNVNYYGRANYITSPRPHTDLPFYREWLGDNKVERIDARNETDAAAATSLFPELRELFFVDQRDNHIKKYIGPSSENDYSVPVQGRISAEQNKVLPQYLYPIGHGVYIDQQGNVALRLNCTDSGIFSEGLACVRLQENGPYGAIDTSGQMIIPPKFESIGEFHEGYAVVSFKDALKDGYCNRKGDVVIQRQFDHCEPFRDGVALVGDLTAHGRILFGLTLDISVPIEQSAVKYRYIDKKGYSLGQEGFNEDGLIDPELLLPIQVNGLYGFLNIRGDFSIPPQYESAGRFSDGLAAVKLNGKIGFIDRAGKVLIPPLFVRVDDFKDGIAAVAILHPTSQHEAWGIIGIDGKYIVEPKVEWYCMGSLSEGLLPIGVLDDGHVRWGYFNRHGDMVIAPSFDFASEFEGGIASTLLSARTGGTANRKCWIDKTGKMIWKHPDVDWPN